MGVISRGFTGRRRTDENLPPGQYLTEDFPVLSAGPTPRVDLTRWEFAITTESGQRHTWSWSDLQALPAQTPTALTLDNQDQGVTHNIHIFTDETMASSLFDGKDVVGPSKETYTVPPLDAGTYYFHCDTHPTMNGAVKVAVVA